MTDAWKEVLMLADEAIVDTEISGHKFAANIIRRLAQTVREQGEVVEAAKGLRDLWVEHGVMLGPYEGKIYAALSRLSPPDEGRKA